MVSDYGINSKKLGGPGWFILATMLAGYTIIRTAEGTFKFIIKKGHKEIDNLIYEVNNKIDVSDDFSLNTGDKFKVLATHGDTVLVEVIGNDNNPYCISKNNLTNASNYI